MCECTAFSLQRVRIQECYHHRIAVTVAVTIFTIRHVVSLRVIVSYPFIPDRTMSRPSKRTRSTSRCGPQRATISRYFGDTCNDCSNCNNIVHVIVCFRGAKLNWYVWKWPFNQLPCGDLRKTVVENSEMSVFKFKLTQESFFSFGRNS